MAVPVSTNPNCVWTVSDIETAPLFFGSFQGVISVNEANVTYSHGVSINGIFYEINKILFPPDVDKDKSPSVAVSMRQSGCRLSCIISVNCVLLVPAEPERRG